jgi:hypothetical protein
MAPVIAWEVCRSSPRKSAEPSLEEMIAEGEPFSPRLHVAMHHVVASQLLADDPPEAWQTVQRLAGLGL